MNGLITYPKPVRITTKHLNRACAVKFGNYIDGSLAMVLVDTLNDEPLGVPTVCLVDWGFDYSKVWEQYGPVLVLKTWSENDGMVDGLIDAGLIEKTPIMTIGNPYYHDAPPAVVHHMCEDLLAFVKVEDERINSKK